MTKRKYKQGRIINSITDLNIIIKVCKMFDLPIYLRDRPINPKYFENMTLKTLNKMIEGKAIREANKLLKRRISYGRESNNNNNV